jgi:hypothetical protein
LADDLKVCHVAGFAVRNMVLNSFKVSPEKAAQEADWVDSEHRPNAEQEELAVD